MADETNPQGMENIGGIGVTIDADYSPLQAAFARAQGEAEAAGKNIADALSEGASAGADLGEQIAVSLSGIVPAADDASAALGNMGDAATEAAGKEDDASASAEHLGESSHEAGGRIGEMAEQLIAVGEALAITEGLREFGSEALSAADRVTQTTIALTHFTGSAEATEQTLKGLEELGASDALAMPSLYSAATRMTALLPAGTNVVELLGHIADGAAVMGTDIGSAADRFDRMAASGMANARVMTALGLNLDSLAQAINQVNGGADATAENAAKMFKALDESERVEVLSAALAKMGGIAEQVAQQTFGGQWQQLSNAWEATMVQVGQALLPVISELTTFLKLDVFPFLEGLARDFNALPGPVKDAAVAVGLAAAAVVPLTAAVGGLGLAMSGIQNLVPAFNSLLGVLRGASTEAAAAETAAAASTTAHGAAAAAATPQIVAQTTAEAAGTAQLGLFTGATTAYTFESQAATGQMELFTDGLVVMKTEEVAATGAMEAQAAAATETGGIWATIGGASGAGILIGGIAAIVVELQVLVKAWTDWKTQQALAKSEMDDAGTKAVALSMRLQQLGVDTSKLDFAWASGNMSIQAYVSGLIALETQTGVVSEALQQASTTVLNHTQLLAQAIEDAQKKVVDLTAQYLRHKATAEQVAEAQDKLTAAQKAYDAAIGGAPGTLAAVDTATQKLTASGMALVNQQELARDTQVAYNARLADELTSYNQAQVKLQLLTSLYHDWAKAQDGSASAAQSLLAVEAALSKQVDVVQKAQDSLNTSVEQYGARASAAAATTNETLLTALQSLAAAVGPVMAGMLGLDGQITALQSAMPNFGIQMGSGVTTPLRTLQSALDEATDKVAKYGAELARGMDVGKQYQEALKGQLTAQIALDQEQAVLSAGLGGSTDALSLLKTAFVEAKAKNDDLTAAFQAGIATRKELASSIKATFDAQVAFDEQSAISAAGLQGLTDKVSLAEAAYQAARAKLDDYTQAYQQGLVTYAQVEQAQKQMETAQKNLNDATSAATPLVISLTDAERGLVPAITAVDGAIAEQVSALGKDVAQVQTLSQALKQIQSDFTAAFGGMSSSGGSFPGAPAGFEYSVSNVGGRYSVTLVSTPENTANQAAGKSYYQLVYDSATGMYTSVQVSGSGSSSGTSKGSVLLSPTQPTGITTAGGSIGGAGSTTTTGGISSGSSSQAVNGGVYPDVTAHQAAGEVWSVSVAGTLSGATGGAISESSTQALANAATTQAATQAASVVNAALGTAYQVAGSFQLLAGELGSVSSQIAAAAQAIASKAAGGTLQVILPQGSTSATTRTTSTSSGSSYASGTIIVTGGATGGGAFGSGGSGAGGLAVAPTVSPGGGSGLSVGSLNIDLSGANLSGQSPVEIQQSIQSAVTQSLVASLRAAGARF